MIALDASVLIALLDGEDAAREALADLEVKELALPVDAAVQLAQLRASTSLKMPDCCVLLAAEGVEGRIASFDNRLKDAAVSRNLIVLG